MVEGGTGLSLCPLDALARPQGTWRLQGHARDFDELVPTGWLCQGLCSSPMHPSPVLCLLSNPYSDT